jgi:hypothetical protein
MRRGMVLTGPWQETAAEAELTRRLIERRREREAAAAQALSGDGRMCCPNCQQETCTIACGECGSRECCYDCLVCQDCERGTGWHESRSTGD